jgi:hypothetical protein
MVVDAVNNVLTSHKNKGTGWNDDCSRPSVRSHPTFVISNLIGIVRHGLQNDDLSSSKRNRPGKELVSENCLAPPRCQILHGLLSTAGRLNRIIGT